MGTPKLTNPFLTFWNPITTISIFNKSITNKKIFGKYCNTNNREKSYYDPSIIDDEDIVRHLDILKINRDILFYLFLFFK